MLTLQYRQKRAWEALARGLHELARMRRFADFVVATNEQVQMQLTSLRGCLGSACAELERPCKSTQTENKNLSRPTATEDVCIKVLCINSHVQNAQATTVATRKPKRA